jgi:hypothetical protein
MVLTVREDVGCDPGVLLHPARRAAGRALAGDARGRHDPGWILDVGGTRLVIEAETSMGADADLVAEIEQIVIRFG